MYTADKNAQIVISLLKQYGIRKIVVSPGTTNTPISVTVQNDPWFEVYSVVDERSAAYFATGLAYESNEPVVVSCTGATASRNYLSAMTEAYYRNLPIVALTSQHHTSDYRNLVPQVTDRSTSQNDIKRVSAMLPYIKDDEDIEACEILVNEALIKLTARGGGPVHINLPVDPSYPLIDEPDEGIANRIRYYDLESVQEQSSELKKELSGKKIGIYIGSHMKFNKKLQSSIESFINSYDTVVFADHTSNYFGKNKILTGRIFDIVGSGNRPDILIDMGGISGDYSSSGLGDDIVVWRISEDGEIHKRFRRGSLDRLFDCSEASFFYELSEEKGRSNRSYYNELSVELEGIADNDIPLSGTYIASKMASMIPNNSSLHLSILNSLRNMNLFELDDSVSAISNVGGFGIDGPVSTLVGQSMHDSNRLYFGLIGDLAFFYDMNIIGNRHVGSNVRILIVNNGMGAEFRLNLTNEPRIGDALNSLVAADGHNGSVKAWVESMGFEYISASSIEEFDNQSEDFFAADINHFNKPVVFEVFTNYIDEQSGFDLMRMS